MARSINAVVITGDIVGSSKLNVLKRKKLQGRVTEFANTITASFPDFKMEQFRGDSLQCILTKNKIAGLRIAVLLYCFLAADEFKIRQSVGIGDVSFTGTNIITSDGTAFRLSGENIDELKKRGELINIAFANNDLDEEWKVHSASLNFLLERLSSAQAEALYLQLKNSKQEEIAKALNISQPSVHQRLQAAGWSVISRILQRFDIVAAL
jgi:sigma-70-like protein